MLARELPANTLTAVRETVMREWAGSDGLSGEERFLLSGSVAACEHACVRLAGAGDGAALELTAVLDPLSAAAQTATPLIIELRRSRIESNRMIYDHVT